MIEHEEAYRHLFRTLSVGVAYCKVLTDGPVPHDFQYLDVNEAFGRLTGLNDVIGKRVSEVLPDVRESDRELLEIYSEVALTGQPRNFERYVQALGKWVAVSASCPKKGHFLAVFEVSSGPLLAQALRESEARAVSVLDSMAEGVMIHDASGAVLTCNAAAEEILGLTREQLQGRAMKDPRWHLVREDGTPLPTEERASAKALRTQERVTGLIAGVYRPDGSVAWLSANAAPIRYDAGTQPAAVVATFADITARRHAEDALRASTARLRERESLLTSIVENIPDYVLRYDREGRHLFANSRVYRDAGRSEAEFLGKTHREAGFPEEECLLYESTIAKAFETREPQVRIFEWESVQGRKHLEWRVIPEFAPDGSVATVLGLSRDITAQKQAEAALRASEQALRRAQQVAHVGDWTWEGATNTVSWSDEMKRIWGCDPADFGGDMFAIMRHAIHPDDQAEAFALAESAATTGEAPETEYRVVHQDGTVRHLWVLPGDRFTDEQGKLVRLTGIVQDITERAHDQEALAAQRAQLEELNHSLEDRIYTAVAELREKDQMLVTQSRQAAMGEMIGNIAHQWRQPLNALGLVLNNLRDAQTHGELDDALVLRSVDTGVELVRSMSTTINDFRDFFRPDKGRVAFSIQAEIARTVELVEAAFLSSGIAIRVEGEEDLHLLGLPNEYGQVLLNLLVNARDAIAANRIRPGLVQIHVSDGDHQGHVSVRDNGGGIPRDVLDRVFDPFFSTRESGTGIGLYMSKMIIERSMGGRIEAHNVNGGAEFTIISPLAEEG